MAYTNLILRISFVIPAYSPLRSLPGKASEEVKLQIVGVEADESTDFQQRHLPMISQAIGTHSSSFDENSEVPSTCFEAVLPEGQKPSEASAPQDTPQDLPNGHSSTIEESPKEALPKEEAHGDGGRDRTSSESPAARGSALSQAECVLATTAARPPAREGQATTHSVYTTAMSSPRVNSVELPSTAAVKSDPLAASRPKASGNAPSSQTAPTVESQSVAVSTTLPGRPEAAVGPQADSPPPAPTSSSIRPARPTVLPL